MPVGLKGNSDGSGAIQIGGSDAISISTGLNTTFAGTITATGAVAGTTGTLYPIVSGTAVSATGTSVDFTGIPSWAKRITVMFSGVSTNGTSGILVQSGSGSVETSAYTSINSLTQNAVSPTVTAVTTGFSFTQGQAAADTLFGVLTMSLLGSNIWTYTSSVNRSGATIQQQNGTGAKTFSGTIDRIRITTVNGTDTFDAGTINILYE